MKKQVLIVFTGPLELGGIERSLLAMLDHFDYDRYDVDLFVYGHHGILFPMIDKRANLLPEVRELAYLRDSLRMKLSHGCFFSAFLRIRDCFLALFRPIDNDKTWSIVVRACSPKLHKHYDAAISFFRPFDFITEKTNAAVKIGWVHTDYSKTVFQRTSMESDYAKVDYIAVVSEECRNRFIETMPSMEDKTLVVGNVLSPAMIKEQAEAYSIENELESDGCLKLLSIGRFCTAKNFDNVPDICRRVRERGLDVKWYLIGYGPDEALIRQRISESCMEDHVIILGKKQNPYPYIKACDLYVQPSRYEGKCVSVLEAQILGKPVVITRYPTSSSQLEEGVDGAIVPQDNEDCANGIAALLMEPERMERFSKTCASRDYSNAGELKKLYALIDD